ncbi:MAG: TatD family hydrolase [Caulobacterales bacterium]|nr:TatD family hydrolase [Caulobacterales bacterium]
MLIDSHVNLHAEAFDADRDDVLARARDAGVARMIAICARWSDVETVRGLAERHPDIWATAGAHPHHAKDRPDISAGEIAELADHPRVCAIGETGLDMHYGYSPEADQIASFRAHIGAARALGLPLIIHTREASALMGDILEEEHAAGPFAFLLHCYTSGAALARRGAALGGYFSVNGIATFKNAADVRDVIVADMPADRIILETDSPYLAPAPHRGRRNEPAYLAHVADKLAELRGWSREETLQRTADNFFRLFPRVSRPETAAS